MFPLSPYVRISQRNTSTTGVTALLLTRSHLTGISYLKNASLNTLYSFNIRFTSRTRPTVSTLSRKKRTNREFIASFCTNFGIALHQRYGPSLPKWRSLAKRIICSIAIPCSTWTLVHSSLISLFPVSLFLH